MIILTSEEIQKALDKLTELNKKNDGFISVRFTENQNIVVRLQSMKYKAHDAPDALKLYSSTEKKEVSIKIVYEKGPAIVPALGQIKKHPPYAGRNGKHHGNGGMGGDQCRNVNNFSSYGTISFYANRISYEVLGGQCAGMICEAGPVLVSNNHVIARSDAGERGEIIWTRFREDVARLECFIPFSCKASRDFAMARVDNTNGISTMEVRDIGRLVGIRHPNIGEGIRKHGARTGLTSGSVTGQANILVGSYTYYGVFSTSSGFGCRGDSGSAVVGNDKNVLGLYSWGDDTDCTNNPVGYFWSFVDQKGILNNDESSLVGISWNDLP